ncbi:DUF433 domain-containing protein [Roseovarius sp. THAF27]|uniref:DUF433 domain-containing protein n=1 Tax=Roseovarius sp. THAF27 TaxID=2587850 RepID=UPI001561B177|nr:DUF433 domain-containing protein [Roseovarius sp. THAF27]
MGTSQANSNVVALTEDHVSRVTGLTKGQLRAWDRKGFFQPKFAYDDRKAAYSRFYSFKDVVGLKTIETLRSKYKIGFKKLKDVAEELKAKGFDHWADTTLYVVKKEVHFRNPQTGDIESLRDGQLAMLAVIDVINDVQEKVAELSSRPQEKVGAVERHKFVARNSWVISGTRIPTSTIRRYYEAGFSVEQILTEYPSLTAADVQAALDHENCFDKSA